MIMRMSDFTRKTPLTIFIDRLESECGVVIRHFRADCGSYSEDIINYIKDVCEHFYIRASNCGSLRTKFMEHEQWEDVTIGNQKCGVTSFKFDAFLESEGFRLIVQRTDIKDEYPEEDSDGIFGKEYIHRWSHLPFSYLKENTVFLLVTAMLKNFYVYILDILKDKIEGLDKKSRVKRFIRYFMTVPAKWIKSGRSQVLNLYTKKKVYL